MPHCVFIMKLPTVVKGRKIPLGGWVWWLAQQLLPTGSQGRGFHQRPWYVCMYYIPFLYGVSKKSPSSPPFNFRLDRILPSFSLDLDFSFPARPPKSLITVERKHVCCMMRPLISQISLIIWNCKKMHHRLDVASPFSWKKVYILLNFILQRRLRRPTKEIDMRLIKLDGDDDTMYTILCIEV